MFALHRACTNTSLLRLLALPTGVTGLTSNISPFSSPASAVYGLPVRRCGMQRSCHRPASICQCFVNSQWFLTVCGQEGFYLTLTHHRHYSFSDMLIQLYSVCCSTCPQHPGASNELDLNLISLSWICWDYCTFCNPEKVLIHLNHSYSSKMYLVCFVRWSRFFRSSPD
jgi:hypothetical protein